MSVLSVENLGKSYRVGHRSSERYVALRDVIAQGARNVVRKSGDLLRGRPVVEGDEVEEFWALRNVSFDVKQGGAVGIIGRNGAGKSTLLKILSRITEPTEGRARIRGRVASLLEVGTGFHPELTGRENIYLNGAILSMKRGEIRRKFDEIVAFAEVEQFLDTPVKRYSSGMYVRLAFAVAAHLEPEILVVDEVLAVGDAAFQKKCLGKMSDVTQGGRTVLFVSHNLGAVNALCGQCLLLERGRLVDYGPSDAVTRRYLGHAGQSPASVAFEPQGVASLLSVGMQDSAGTPGSVFDIRHPVWVRLEFRLAQRIAGLQVAIAVFDTKSTEFKEWKLPMPWAAPYDVAVDKNGNAWTGSMLNDRITRLDPKTGQFTEYLLPRQTNVRRVFVDNTTSPVTFWVGSNHGASIIKLEPLE